jgi:hypothetical protein
MKLKEANADFIVTNDIDSDKYKKNPDNNNVIIVDSKAIIQSGWKSKMKIVKLLRNEIEKRFGN